jgi:hypothetical protein
VIAVPLKRREAIVPDYRIFIFNRDDHFVGVELVFDSTDDGVLTRAAEKVTDQHGAEVWERARLVGRLAPRDQS